MRSAAASAITPATRVSPPRSASSISTRAPIASRSRIEEVLDAPCLAPGRKGSAGERGHDASADQRDQQRQQIERDPERDAAEAGEHAHGIQMHAEIGQQEYPEHRQENPIAWGRRLQGGRDGDR